MTTMFVSRDNANKKRFQKPNILRRKPKGPTKVSPEMESLGVKSLVTDGFEQEPKSQQETNAKEEGSQYPSRKPSQKLILDNKIISNGSRISEVCETNINSYSTSDESTENSYLVNNNEESVSQCPVNVESFLNDSTSVQNNSQFDVDTGVNSYVKQEWCLDFINNVHEIVIEDFDGSRLGSLHVGQTSINTTVPLSPVMSADQALGSVKSDTPAPAQNLSIEYLANSTMIYKCDVPECTKRFRSEQKLQKHKNVHNPDLSIKSKSNIECPVKNEGEDGEKPCGRIFQLREDLVRHLNEDHTLDEAGHMCSICGRRFFWASGLRAHGRAHCGRAAPLPCAWPGCSRVFRQPCRLREHQRAHTGDKPYPCRYPNCGWSFRTASKLVRHARRHTGERRHACAVCGRAFPRREHLRDHHARHHRDKHGCQHPGCSRTFTNLDALYRHMKKLHKTEDSALITPISTTASKNHIKDTFMVNLDPIAQTTTLHGVEESVDASTLEAESALEAEVDAGPEWHAARTHCTWPLAPRDPALNDTVDTEYVLEEDVQVELSEGSESNTYTIRSDLFLHGNILHNEDSEHIPGAETGSLLVVPQSEADLSLLDTHPTIDLMQEDLMYTDAAVDESSFRVFLLSGEELA